MKNLIYLFFLALPCVLFACSKGVTGKDLPDVLPGRWTNHVDTSDDGESEYLYQQIIEEYKTDGVYYAEGVVEIRERETDKVLLRVTGPDEGVWVIVDGKLEVKLFSSEILTFESSDPFFTRALFEAVLAHEIKTPSIYEVIEMEEDRLLLREQDGTCFELIRSK